MLGTIYQKIHYTQHHSLISFFVNIIFFLEISSFRITDLISRDIIILLKNQTIKSVIYTLLENSLYSLIYLNIYSRNAHNDRILNLELHGNAGQPVRNADDFIILLDSFIKFKSLTKLLLITQFPVFINCNSLVSL